MNVTLFYAFQRPPHPGSGVAGLAITNHILSHCLALCNAISHSHPVRITITSSAATLRLRTGYILKLCTCICMHIILQGLYMASPSSYMHWYCIYQLCSTLGLRSIMTACSLRSTCSCCIMDLVWKHCYIAGYYHLSPVPEENIAAYYITSQSQQVQLHECTDSLTVTHIIR